MKPNPLFLNQSPEFWAYVRIISQEVGYTNRSDRTIIVPTIAQVRKAFCKHSLSTDHIEDSCGNLSTFGQTLFHYFQYRSDILNKNVHDNLMCKDEAEQIFHDLRNKYKVTSKCPLPLNKQKGDKKNYAFLTCIINMIIEENIDNWPCDYDPRSLTTVTHNGRPLRTLSRRVDGAFPAVNDPIAIWEIKEYYYTTTFGSRVADGVYESLLDGMELREFEHLRETPIHHMLIVDGYFTWWVCGRSYLCRIIDMLHMGYLDEVIFGREVITQLPKVIKKWKETVALIEQRCKETPPHTPRSYNLL